MEAIILASTFNIDGPSVINAACALNSKNRTGRFPLESTQGDEQTTSLFRRQLEDA
jgi:hypothetical protein